MRIKKEIKLPTYNCAIELIITDNIQRVANSIYKKYNLKDTLDYDVEGVVLTIDIDRYYLIFSPQYLSHNTIAHEIYHCVVRVTEERDVVDEEAQAWLSGHITSEVYRFFSKKGIKVLNS
jgi:hypothetical protein